MTSNTTNYGLNETERSLVIKKYSLYHFTILKLNNLKNYILTHIKNLLLQSKIGIKIFFILKTMKNRIFR